MLMTHNFKRYKNHGRLHTMKHQQAKMTGSQPPWYLRYWIIICPRTRLHVSSSQITNSITIFLLFIAFIITLFLVQILMKSKTTDKPRYIPMIQFDRGDVSRDEILENARGALRKIADFEKSTKKERLHPKSLLESVSNILDKKEKRQFLALEAFNVHDMEDFKSLMEIGFGTSKKDYYTLPDYKNRHTEIESVAPNYDVLCYNTSFTLSNSKRPMDSNFCDRLKFLEKEIHEGRDLPLLTIYTWWPDPITDEEVLSKRAVMTNWQLLRPFIIPVVFTNFRMNMAVANAHGWPCLPVEYENEAQQPIFKYTVAAMKKTFKSTFYGYARANSMFDSSLLLTLLSIKDRYVQNSFPPLNINDKNVEGRDTPQEDPLIIYGRPVLTSAANYEIFEKMENFHTLVENAIRKDENSTASMAYYYVIYKSVDFRDDAPVVIEDDYLVPYLIQRRLRYKSTIIDASDTILCAKTHRQLVVNDWGRKYIQTKPFNDGYDKKHFDHLKSQFNSKENTKANNLVTVYDDKNRVCVRSKKEPLD